MSELPSEALRTVPGGDVNLNGFLTASKSAISPATAHQLCSWLSSEPRNGDEKRQWTRKWDFAGWTSSENVGDVRRSAIEVVAPFINHGSEWGDPCDLCEFADRNPFEPADDDTATDRLRGDGEAHHHG